MGVDVLVLEDVDVLVLVWLCVGVGVHVLVVLVWWCWCSVLGVDVWAVRKGIEEDEREDGTEGRDRWGT